MKSIAAGSIRGLDTVCFRSASSALESFCLVVSKFSNRQKELSLKNPKVVAENSRLQSEHFDQTLTLSFDWLQVFG